MDKHLLMRRDNGHLDGMMEKRDSSIGIDHSGGAQAEHILGEGEWFRDGEGAKKGIAWFQSLLESDFRDFTGSGVDLMVVIAIDFVFEHTARFIDGG